MLARLLEFNRQLKAHFYECKTFYFVNLTVLFLGIGIGFFTKVNVLTVDITIYVNVTFSRTFFSYFIEVVVCMLIVNIVCINIYFSPLSLAVIVVRGVMIARSFLIVSTLFGFSGVIFTVLFLAPFQIFFSLLLVMVASGAMERCFRCRYIKSPILVELKEVLILSAFALLVCLIFNLIFSLLYIRLTILL